MNEKLKWLIGITDYVTAPADIEQQAFPEAEFVFLDDWRASERNRQQWQRTDALLVWHWSVDKAAETARMFLVEGKLRNRVS